MDDFSHLTDYDSDCAGAKFGIDGNKITAVRNIKSVGNNIEIVSNAQL